MSERLSEKYIQEIAVDFLKNYYQQYSHNKKIHAAQEEYTIQGKRADGLIAWEKASDTIRVVSMEAKSAATIRNLLTRWDEEYLNRSSFFIAEGLLLLVFSVLYYFFGLRLPLEPFLLLLILIALPVLWFYTKPLLLKIVPQFFKTADVLQQVALYPGNEMWIAIGSDTFIMKKEERMEALFDQCKRRKFGLLEIQADESPPKILLWPHFFPSDTNSDFLVAYKKEAAIRQKVTGARNSWTVFNYSRPERKYYINQLLRSVVITGLILFSLIDFDAKKNDPIQPKSSNPSIVDLARQLDEPSLNPPQRARIVNERPQDVAHRDERRSIPEREVDREISENIEFEENQETSLPIESTIVEEIVDVTPPMESTPPTNCETLPFSGKKYILKDQLFATRWEAQDRVRQLKEAGCHTADYFWLPCVQNQIGVTAWCVYAYPARSSKEKVKNSLIRYTYFLKNAKLNYNDADIWQVENREE